MKRVLIVDDDADIVESLRMLLEETYDVEVALNGEQGLEAILEAPPDAMVLDLMMPVMDGAELVRELRARGIWIPVLLASATRDLPAQARALAVEDYLLKPFDPVILEDKLARLATRP